MRNEEIKLIELCWVNLIKFYFRAPGYSSQYKDGIRRILLLSENEVRALERVERQTKN